MNWLGFGLTVAMILFGLAIVLQIPQLMLVLIVWLVVVFFGIAMGKR